LSPWQAGTQTATLEATGENGADALTFAITRVAYVADLAE